MADDGEIDLDAIEKRMDGALNSLRNEFLTLRTGRASASMLEPVMVDAYGAPTPINQVATVNVPEPRMITVNVWDKSMELNEERRRELAKLAGNYAENARIAVRNVRKDGMDQLKKAKDDMSEDDEKLWADEIQTLTDGAIKNIDDVLEGKQAEIMQV